MTVQWHTLTGEEIPVTAHETKILRSDSVLYERMLAFIIYFYCVSFIILDVDEGNNLFHVFYQSVVVVVLTVLKG